MINEEIVMSSEVEPERPASEGASVSFKGLMVRLVQKLKADKSAADKQFGESILALKAWEKECKAELAKKEESIRRRYDSIDVTLYDDERLVKMKLAAQQAAEDQAFDAEVERVLKNERMEEKR